MASRNCSIAPARLPAFSFSHAHAHREGRRLRVGFPSIEPIGLLARRARAVRIALLLERLREAQVRFGHLRP